MLQAFLHGFVLAFGLILPLGPQNTFVFTQGATQKHWFLVLPAIVTAALCDTLLITIAVLGVSTLVISLPIVKVLLGVIGVAFLVYIGWITWHRSIADTPVEGAASVRRQIVFAMSVSLLNPHAILDTIGVIGTSSLAYVGSEKLAFTIACAGISWLWFLTLAVAGRVIGRFDAIRQALNRVSAVIMWISAVYLVFNLARIQP